MYHALKPDIIHLNPKPMRSGIFILCLFCTILLNAQGIVLPPKKIIYDNIPPVAVCDGNEQISLTSIPTKVAAITFDDGSWDETCLSHFLVKRMNEPDVAFSSFIEFNCADVAFSPIKVVLRVVDCAGNVNDCWSNAYIEDKTKPTVWCPQDVTINCGVDPEAYWGTPIAGDNCGIVSLSNTTIDATDQCQQGYISRIWTAKDEFNNFSTCTQRIYRKHISDYSVTFPNDVNLATCISPDDLKNTGEPKFTNLDCELAAVGFTDHDLPVTDGKGCFVRLRKWQIISWCNYDPNKPTHTPLGIPQGGKKYKDDDGYFEYTQLIKVFEVADPKLTCKDTIVCIQANDCLASFMIPKPKVVDCSTDITYNITGDLGAGFNPVDVAPGIYQVQHLVTDGCGNYSTCKVKVTVKDCKKPTPVVIHGLSTTIAVINAKAIIWASDFNKSCYDNCTNSKDLKFSFSADTNDIFKAFPCDSLGLRTVKIWATDKAGNQDFAVTTIDIQDNMNACDTTANKVQLSGDILDAQLNPISGLKLINPYVNISSDSLGNFNSPLLNLQMPFQLALEYTQNAADKISVKDVILLKNHLLGIKKLNHPYQYLAADVNRSYSLSTADLFQLKQMILGTYKEWPSSPTFLYVNKNDDFDKPEDIWTNSFTKLDLDASMQDSLKYALIGIKTGNIALSNPDNLIQNKIRSSNYVMAISDDNIVYTSDEKLNGAQFAIMFDHYPSELEVHYGTHSLTRVSDAKYLLKIVLDEIIEPKQELVSWQNANATNVPDLQALAVNEEGEVSDIQFVAKLSNEIVDIQIFPNPAQNILNILVPKFAEGNAQLNVLSAEGKILVKKEFSPEYSGKFVAIPINLPNALYFVSIQTSSRTFYNKFSVENQH